MPSPEENADGRPLRVAYCITELEPGGAERALVELATRLDRQRFDPAIYVLSLRPAAPRDVLVRKVEAAGIPLQFLDARTGWQAPAVVRRVADALRQQRAEVVHSFLFHANMLARFASPRAGVARVICGIRVAERQTAWHRWLDRLTQRHVEKYVCVSQAVSDFSRDVTGLPAEKLVVIPNGVDAESLSKRPRRTSEALGLPENRRFLVCVGRLDHQKGIDRLLEAAPRLLAALPQHDLVLVGDGPLRDAATRQAGAAPLRGRVHLTGWRADAADFIAAADALLLPSRWEGMPNVVLEAMALACPVIATDVEGVRELLTPHDEHQVTPRDDMRAFIDATVALVKDSALAAQLAAANQNRAREQFSFERIVALHEALYAALVASRTAS